MRPRALFLLVVVAVLPGAENSSEDVFRVFKEPSPREAAIFREMRLVANATKGSRPYDGRRVVVAMTTTPSRIGLIEPALDSILRQTHPVDAVYLFVPYVFRRDGSSYSIPAWLASKVGVTLIRCQDEGPGTHMLAVLRHERDPNTYIVQVDDDQSYGPGLVSALLSATGPCPGRAIGAATQHGHTHLGGSVTEGVHGVLFQRKLFGANVFDFDGFDPSCRLHDDLWLSAHLAERAVRRETLGERFGSVALQHGFQQDALYRGGAGSDNTRNFYLCMAAMLHKAPRLWDAEDRVVIAAPLPTDPVDGIGVAAEALRLLRQSVRRRPGLGPHAVYLVGQVPEALWAEVRPENIQIDGCIVLHAGEWGESFDIVVKDCVLGGEGCDLSAALNLALYLEEDAETLIIVADSSDPSRFQKLLRSHTDCHNSRKKDNREPCHGVFGSMSFRRHSAFEEGRIQGGIFLPIFSSYFHFSGGWVEGFRLANKGKIWRDELGTWQKAPTEYIVFSNFLGRGMHQGEALQNLWQEHFDMHRRVVATLPTGKLRRRFPLLRATLRSLIRQDRQKLARVYVLVQTRRKSRWCAPSWLRSWPRVLALCDHSTSGGAPLLTTITRERKPDTLIFHCDDGHRYGSRLLVHLVLASTLWAGNAVACSGLIHGKHGGPIGHSGLGTLYRRSFLDTRLADDLENTPCSDSLDISAAAHAELKGVITRVIGHTFGTRRIRRRSRGLSLHGRSQGGRVERHTACRNHLISQYGWIWASQRPERCLVLVSLLEGTDAFLLDLTLRYAGLQTRKPDEVLLLAPSTGILGSSAEAYHLPANTEVILGGSLGNGFVELRRPNGTRFLDVPLATFLNGLRDRAGCVVRVHSKFGPPRTFVLSVASCYDSRCHVRPALQRSFEHELDPETALMFVSADRLVNERLVEDNLRCLSACYPRCTAQNWCGQSPAGAHAFSGAIYDLTVRRSAGYVEHTAY
eukprot:TRINITY_DN71911_c0_g1_i1.p1 TRINITY_DN71911_c0_g1~~TRINITY_DN71911_c0_g1_i1.p1  ORF type:complete len:971 (-),score=48.77 TRINITY_DN71911_c0_g1_i1:168-3080(-)